MKWLLLIPILCLCSCATSPKTYAPPSPTKLQQSTQRVSKAVTAAHTHANQAKQKVQEATEIAHEVAKEAATVKTLPPTLLGHINDLEAKLDETRTSQSNLEADLVEADKAKTQVEQDKTEYFSAAQKLADAATIERDKRIKDETTLHWYRVHFFLGWIIFGTGVLACVVLAILKISGKLAGKMPLIL